jgi:hypothetical protein
MGKETQEGVFPLKSSQILNFLESSKFASAGQKGFFDTLGNVFFA